MKLSDGYVVSTEEVSPHKFGGDPMAEYLHYLTGHGGQDNDTGTVGWHYFVAIFGKRLLFEDTQGFVWVDKYSTISEASEVFDAIDAEYSAGWEEES